MERGGVAGEAIRFLGEDDAEDYAALRREMLLDAPLSFAASPEDDVAGSVEAVRDQIRRAPETVIAGAFRPRLVGAVGLYRDRHVKAAHKAHVWGMYVKPAWRRQGLAAALLEAVLAHARSLPGIGQVHIGVSSTAPDARRLYERFGFRAWGEEPEALRHGGASAAEAHMILRLGPAG
jgi:RimJ/RimL family protein N-acetyltransferase